MPKDEFDFDDPLELTGVSLECGDDTTAAMTECFVEEFLRLGHNHKQILALFRNPHYLGMNLALAKHGEPFVRDTITEVFARRGQVVTWATAPDCTLQCADRSPPSPAGDAAPAVTGQVPPREDADTPAPSITTDPMGAPVPEVTT